MLLICAQVPPGQSCRILSLACRACRFMLECAPVGTLQFVELWAHEGSATATLDASLRQPGPAQTVLRGALKPRGRSPVIEIQRFEVALPSAGDRSIFEVRCPPSTGPPAAPRRTRN